MFELDKGVFVAKKIKFFPQIIQRPLDYQRGRGRRRKGGGKEKGRRREDGGRREGGGRGEGGRRDGGGREEGWRREGGGREEGGRRRGGGKEDVMRMLREKSGELFFPN